MMNFRSNIPSRNSDKGKPGESWGRKANGSNVTMFVTIDRRAAEEQS